jgi:kynurenine 3-monooxygenase
MMGLANLDGSFTMTLYMHEKGPVSFANLQTRESIEAFFSEHYRDAAPLMPTYVEDFLANPVGFLGTVFCDPWVYQDKFALIGDAAHAFTPFFGQGCNSGFEDVSVLHELLLKQRRNPKETNGPGMSAVLEAYYAERKANADAIANMALENFDEMMSKTADARFLLEKEIENELAKRYPEYISRYVLITHSLFPYRLCQEVGVIQSSVLAKLSEGLKSVGDVDWARASALISDGVLPFLTEKGAKIFESVYYDE